jgi:hypothetical protein
MKSIFEFFFPRNNFKPPKAVLHSLKKNFGVVMNVEWSEDEGFYEAVFYHLDTEYIARFSATGELLVSKINLRLHMVKPEIARQALAVGELMNLIEITSQGKIFYEVIARDKYLDRFYLFMEEDGTLLEKRKL